MNAPLSASAVGAAIGAHVTDSPAAAAVSAPAVLPEPQPGGLTGTQDAISMLFSMVARQGELQLQSGQQSVASANRSQDAEIQKEAAAEQAQEQAEANQGGFWHSLLSVAEDIAKVVGVVVAVAAAAVATVFTGGTAGIAIAATAAVLVSSGAVVSATHCLGKYSAYFGMGMEVAGSVLTMGATSATVASSAVTDVAQTVTSAGQLVQGTATVVAGVSSIEVGKFQSESEEDQADVQEAIDAIARSGRLVSEVTDDLKSDQKTTQKSEEILAGAAQTYGQTLVTAGSGGRA